MPLIFRNFDGCHFCTKQCKNLIDFIQSEGFFSLFHFTHKAKSYP